ncbi:hypothetical protein AX16_005779 [Volvariella volvacea WC 439]|nr:hypothetical protein AX16_005779 [Volvariella volvacea WC 439]
MVRSFKCKPLGGSAAQVNSMIYASIARHFGCLVPNLQNLYIDLRNASSLHDFEYVLPAIYSPSLRHVTAWNGTPVFDIYPILATMCSFCGDIQTVTISGHACSASLDAIHSFRGLEKLDLSINDRSTNRTAAASCIQQFLKRLALIGHLRGLVLDFMRTHDLSIELEAVLGLFSLQHLSLRGHPTFVVPLMNHIHAASLTDLDLELICQTCSTGNRQTGFHMHWDDMASLMHIISRQWSRTLKSFKIRLACNRIYGSRTLESLLGHSLPWFVQLRSLKLMDDFNCLVPMSTKEWSVLKTKLKHLQVLYLPNAVVSLTGLRGLAYHLPNLHALGVRVSLQEIPPIGDSHPLHNKLKYSRLDDPSHFQ